MSDNSDFAPLIMRGQRIANMLRDKVVEASAQQIDTHLRERNAELESTVTRLERELESLRAGQPETGARSEDLTAAQEKSDLLQRQLNESHAELERTRGWLSETRSQLAGDAQDHANHSEQQLRSQLTTAHEELEKVSAERNRLVQQLNQQQQQFSEALTAKLEQEQSHSQDHEQLRSEREVLLAELQESQRQTEAARFLLHQAQEEGQAMRARLEQAEAETREASSAQERAQLLESENQRLMREVERVIAEAGRLSAGRQQETDQLRAELEQTRARLKDATTLLEQWQASAPPAELGDTLERLRSASDSNLPDAHPRDWAEPRRSF